MSIRRKELALGADGAGIVEGALTTGGVGVDTEPEPDPDNKLYLHVGQVLFTLNHRDKLDALNICPQCRMRDTC